MLPAVALGSQFWWERSPVEHHDALHPSVQEWVDLAEKVLDLRRRGQDVPDLVRVHHEGSHDGLENEWRGIDPNDLSLEVGEVSERAAWV